MGQGRYGLIWSRGVDQDVARVRTDGQSDSNQAFPAMRSIEDQLSRDPSVGVPLTTKSKTIDCYPLRVWYQVDEEQQLVVIDKVARAPRAVTLPQPGEDE